MFIFCWGECIGHPGFQLYQTRTDRYNNVDRVFIGGYCRSGGGVVMKEESKKTKEEMVLHDFKNIANCVQ